MCDSIQAMRFLLMPLFALTVAAQTPSFEVASIRPTSPPSIPASLCGAPNLNPETLLSPQNLQASVALRITDLIIDGYRNEVDDFDLPQWAATAGVFAVSVKIPPNTKAGTCRHMIRNLLAERFHLVTDVETRDVLRFYLKVAKSGLKLKPAAGPPSDPTAIYTFDAGNGLRTFRGASMARIVSELGAPASLYATARKFRIAGLAGLLDQTGLTGSYNGEFKFTSSIASQRSGLAESLPEALERQLGLTIELRKSPGKVLVIRSSDRTPTEN